MADLTGFNANEHESQSFDVIPAGEYEACIIKSELKPTSSGTGQMLKLQLQIVNGPFANRIIFDQLNIKNDNATAQKIALGTLSDICKAVGVLTPKDSSDLHNKTMRVKVVVKKSDEYGEQNSVKGYKPRQAGGTTTPAPGPLTGNPTPPSGTPSAPWKQAG